PSLSPTSTPRPDLPSSSSLLPPPPTSPLFPYTTLFRSQRPLGRSHEPSLDPQLDLRPQDSARDVPHTPIGRLDLAAPLRRRARTDRKSTRLNSSHVAISYAVFCLKKKNKARSRVDVLRG